MLRSDPSDTPLFAAVRDNNINLILNLLQQSNITDLSQVKTSLGVNLFHVAVLYGHKKLFDALLTYAKEKSANTFQTLLTNLKDNRGRTPWHWAAEHGHAEFFPKLKLPEQKAKTHSREQDIQETETLEEILVHAWTNTRDNDGNTPLHLAVMYESNATDTHVKRKKRTTTAIARLPNIKFDMTNNASLTPLSRALRAGKLITAKALLVVNEDYRDKEYNQTKQPKKNKTKKTSSRHQSQSSRIYPDNNSEMEEDEEESKTDIHEEVRLVISRKPKKIKQIPTLIPVKKIHDTEKKITNGHTIIASLLTYYSAESKDYRVRGDEKKKKKNELTNQDATADSETKTEPTGVLLPEAPLASSNTSTEAKSDEDKIIAEFNNPNLTERQIEQQLKELSVDQALLAIRTYTQALKNKNKWRNMVAAFLGAICPALTAGTMFGTAGGVINEGNLATIITGGLLPFFYVPFVWSCYQEKAKQYDMVIPETLYLNWLKTRIQDYENNIRNELKNILDQIKNLTGNSSAYDSVHLEAELKRLRKEYKSWEDRVNNDGIFTLTEEDENGYSRKNELGNTKKPKFKLHFISDDEFTIRKKVAVNDPKENSDWAVSKDKVAALMSHSVDTWCPTGALLTIGATLSSIIFSKVGLGFLGVGAASFLAGPVGIAVVTIGFTLLLAITLGIALSKPTFVGEKAERGSKNKDLIGSYYDCKVRAKNVDKLRSTMQKTEKGLQGIQKKITEAQGSESPPMERRTPSHPIHPSSTSSGINFTGENPPQSSFSPRMRRAGTSN